VLDLQDSLKQQNKANHKSHLWFAFFLAKLVIKENFSPKKFTFLQILGTNIFLARLTPTNQQTNVNYWRN
jgi:hypothetical protein